VAFFFFFLEDMVFEVYHVDYDMETIGLALG